MVVEAEVPQHHGGAQDERRRVGLVLALDVEPDVAAAGLEDGHVAAHVAARHDASPADQPGADVGQDAAVQIRHHHDVELLRARDALHRRVVDDHVVALERRVVLGDFLDRVAEQTVGELHDVGLVHACDLLAVVRERKGEGELGDALGFGAGDDLQRLDHTGDRLVLQARVLAFGVFANDAKIHILVPRLVAGNVLDEDD